MGSGSLTPSIDPDTFSIRLKGQIEAKYSEAYSFYTYSEENIRVWINNQLVVDHWAAHEPSETSGGNVLQTGQKYDIKIFFQEGLGWAAVKLSWSSASQPKEIVPKRFLYLLLPQL